jgi:hypothetical protein
MRKPCLFKERDVRRAAKAVMSAGLNVVRVEIEKDGRIVVVPGKSSEPQGNPSNDWDEALARDDTAAEVR